MSLRLPVAAHRLVVSCMLALCSAPLWADDSALPGRAAKPAAASATAKPFQPYVRLSRAPSSPLAALAFSPDGRTLALATGEVIRLWDFQRGLDLGTLSGSTESFQSVAFSPDGQRVVAGSANTATYLWHVDSGELLGTAQAEVTFPVSAAYSPDGRWFAVGGSGAAVYDVTTGERKHRLEAAGNGNVTALHFSPDGERLATFSDLGWRLWNMKDGQPLAQPLPAVPAEQVVALSADFERALRFDGRQLTLLNAATGQALASVAASGVTRAVFSADGLQVAWVQLDGQAWRWRRDTGAPVRLALDAKITAHPSRGPHLALAFSPDGQRVAIGSMDHAARVWDGQGRLVAMAGERMLKLRSIAYSRDGSALALGHANGSTSLLDLAAGKLIALNAKPLPAGVAPAPEGAAENIRQPGQLIDVSPDGRTVAAVSQGQLRLFGRGTGNELALLGPAAAKDLRYSRDGRLLFVLEDTRLQVWDPAARSLVQQVLLGKEVADAQALHFNAAGTQLWLWAQTSKPSAFWWAAWPLSAQGLGTALRVNVPGLPTPLPADAFYNATVSPDGRLLALGEGDFNASVIDVASGRVLQKLEGVPPYATPQFSSDGKVLMAYGADVPGHDILRWDVATGKPLPALVGHQAQVRAITASAAGRHLASGGDDGTLIFWHPRTGEALAEIGLYANQGWALVTAQGHYELSSPTLEDAVVLRLGDERANMAPASTQRQRQKTGLLKPLINGAP